NQRATRAAQTNLAFDADDIRVVARELEVHERGAVTRAHAVRHGAGGVVGDQRRTTRGGDDGRGPHVERRQVQVEVEDFRAVQRFEETDFDRLRLVGRVDHRQQGRVAVVDG